MSDPNQQMILHFFAKITEKQEAIIMETIQNICGETFREITIDKYKVLEALTDYINKQKGVEAAEVKHGAWLNVPPYRDAYGHYRKGQECSVCHSFFVSDGNEPYSNHPYCCECGARMDGGVNL